MARQRWAFDLNMYSLMNQRVILSNLPWKWIFKEINWVPNTKRGTHNYVEVAVRSKQSKIQLITPHLGELISLEDQPLFDEWWKAVD